MAKSKITELRKEISDLRQLAIQLGQVIFRNIIDRGGVSNIRGEETAPRLLVAIPIGEIAALLREVSLHCIHASRDLRGEGAALEFEALGVELADEAQKLEALRQPRP